MSSVTLYAWLTGAGCWQRGLEPSLHDLVEWDWVQIFLQNKYGGECRLGRAMSFWSVLGFPASKHQERVSMNFFNGPFGHQEAWCEQFIGDFIYRDSEFTSHCRIAAKTNLLLFFPARFTHTRYSSRMVDRFLNWGDHGKPKSGKIEGRCQPPPPPPPCSWQ